MTLLGFGWARLAPHGSVFGNVLRLLFDDGTELVLQPVASASQSQV